MTVLEDTIYQGRRSRYYRNRWRCQLSLTFLDADMLMDISDYDGSGSDIKEQAYLDIDKALEYVPDGRSCMPYHMWQMRQEFCITEHMFEEHGWEIPETWDGIYRSL